MLGVEILFRFDSRATKDSILNNYEAKKTITTDKRPMYKDNDI